MGKTYRRSKTYWDDDTETSVKGRMRKRKKQSKMLTRKKANCREVVEDVEIDWDER